MVVKVNERLGQNDVLVCNAGTNSKLPQAFDTSAWLTDRQHSCLLP